MEGYVFTKEPIDVPMLNVLIKSIVQEKSK